MQRQRERGLSTASLKKILGHDRLETTEIYLNISPEDTLSEFFQKIGDDRWWRWGIWPRRSLPRRAEQQYSLIASGA